MSLGGRPKKSRIFSVGKEVEVRRAEEGFADVWYTTTILKSFYKKCVAKVRYRTLLAANSETDYLENYVKYKFMRPLPPLDLEDSGDDRSFEEHDVVDAFNKDGWWKGVVTKVRVLEDNSRIYTVVFNSVIPPKEIEYPSSLLRFHVDRVGGKWVRPQKAQEQGELGQVLCEENTEDETSWNTVMHLPKKAKCATEDVESPDKTYVEHVVARMESTLKEPKDGAIDPSSIVGGGVEDVYGEDQVTEDQCITP